MDLIQMFRESDSVELVAEIWKYDSKTGDWTTPVSHDYTVEEFISTCRDNVDNPKNNDVAYPYCYDYYWTLQIHDVISNDVFAPVHAFYCDEGY